MYKLILIAFSIFVLMSCSDKRNKTIVIGYDGEYNASLEGDVTKKIVVNFLKENDIADYRFKLLKKNELLDVLQKGGIDMALDDFEKYKSGAIKNYLSSGSLYSRAVYFIMNEDESKIFKYPESLNVQRTGIIFESETSEFLKFISPQMKTVNFYRYRDIGNLLKDFSEKKIDIAVLNRTEFYRNLATLPETYLYFIEDENYYGKILFSKKILRDMFNNYLLKRKSHKHDWSDILGKIIVMPLF